LREDQPSPHELAAAYQRFERRPQRRAPALVVSRWLIAGLAMGLGIAFGAEAVEQRVHPPVTAVTPSARTPSGVANPARNRVPAPPPASAPIIEPPPAVVEEKRPLTPRFPAVKQSEPLPADSAVWAKAAQGLRNNDVAQTESALATLEQAGTLADREAARLIRAQLLLHQGDTSGARALLQDLASNAQSSLVRAKARRLLTQNSTPSNSPLNVAPSGT